MANPGSAADSGIMRILVIDDDAELCQLVADYLGPMGFEVTSTQEGEDGAARATET